MKLFGRGASRFCSALGMASAMLSLTPGYAQDVLAPVESFAAVAAECVGDEAKYWRMRNLLLARAGLWSSGESMESFAVLAADAGLEPSAFARCFESRRPLQRSLAHRHEIAVPAFAEPAAAPRPLRT
jgi:hypothetical protein